VAVSDDYKIYVDGGQPATLNNGDGSMTDCANLQEAVFGLAQTATRAEDTSDGQSNWRAGLHGA
jgi:hypothetical protein